MDTNNETKNHINIIKEYLNIIVKLINIKKKMNKNMMDQSIRKQYDLLKDQEKVLNGEYHKSVNLLNQSIKQL